ncbi:MAG: hypothetical protein ACI8UO_003848 [Verrucomicrobiales bacterium]|jgi:hypothetical protein
MRFEASRMPQRSQDGISISPRKREIWRFKSRKMARMRNFSIEFAHTDIGKIKHQIVSKSEKMLPHPR